MFSQAHLTPRQSEILNFLTEFQDKKGISPTYREIADYFGFKSTKAAADHVAALEKKGYVRRHNGRSRGIQILFPKKKAKREAISVPILGNVPAGWPELRNAQYSGELMVDRKILGRSAEHRVFALQVRGESMIGRGIYEGDWVIADSDQSPGEGDAVVALIDGKNTLKTLARTKNRFFLKAENPKYPDLIPVEEIVIQGVIRTVIRQMA
ncbi:LexA repressor [Desulfonema magnum]|uniref:LexA repressor n=2 Tax=Desulfonema magnum TaxID=45655 RepID=A0A975BVE0_9BACT|nr:LexA repressor [Desulfonema magnum]